MTVSGLICGSDLIAQLKGRELGERLFISSNMLRDAEQDFLDDVTLSEAAEALGVPINPVGEDGGELCGAMFGILPEIKKPVRAEDTEYNRYNQSRK